MNVGPITGIAGLEAAAQGVPVIALQMLVDYEPSPADWIWSNQDPEKVATEALRLLNDKTARLELAQRQASHVVANHSVQAMANAYEQLYQHAGAAN